MGITLPQLMIEMAFLNVSQQVSFLTDTIIFSEQEPLDRSIRLVYLCFKLSSNLTHE